MKLTKLLIFIVLGTMSMSKAFSQTTFKYNKISFLERPEVNSSELNTTDTYENVQSTVTFYKTLIILTVPDQNYIVTYYIIDATTNEEGNTIFTVFNYLEGDIKSYGYLGLVGEMVFYEKTNSTTVTTFHN